MGSHQKLGLLLPLGRAERDQAAPVGGGGRSALGTVSTSDSASTISSACGSAMLKVCVVLP